MSSTLSDFQVANLAAGFTIGFGILTVWKAIKQTRRLKNPIKSQYIYMVWGELTANIAITIVVWLFLNGKVPPSIETYFVVLFFWAFEIHLIMQLIVNRIYVVAENRDFAIKVKWFTAGIITVVNIGVFCIFIPAHLNPPPSKIFVEINKYWDKATKFIILFVDAGLNWYFLRTVQQRLVRDSGLQKYQKLVWFNARLMVLSVGMDVMIIGLMFLPNPLVFMQFHPVAYTIKLNIEMTMAELITKIATSKENDFRARTPSIGVPDLTSAAHHTYIHHNRIKSSYDSARGLRDERKEQVTVMEMWEDHKTHDQSRSVGKGIAY